MIVEGVEATGLVLPGCEATLVRDLQGKIRLYPEKARVLQEADAIFPVQGRDRPRSGALGFVILLCGF